MVTNFHEFIWKQVDDDAIGVNHDKSKRLMCQQLDPSYVECGSVYVMKTEGFREHRHRFFGKHPSMWCREIAIGTSTSQLILKSHR